jgi:hypothetical protein
MPHSWVRVSYKTSRKIRECQGKSRADFESCVEKILKARGGELERPVHYEQNGKWARLLFKWDNDDEKAKIVYDLEGTDVIDVLTIDEADELERMAEADTPEAD